MNATRDTRPIDAESQRLCEQLKKLALILRHLHSSLLDAVKLDYENQHGSIKGPLILFNLVTNDPFFSWLRPLSGQMAALDQLMDEKKDITKTDISKIRTSIELLFQQTNEPSSFSSNYFARLQDFPKIASYHYDLHQFLEVLPRE